MHSLSTTHSNSCRLTPKPFERERHRFAISTPSPPSLFAFNLQSTDGRFSIRWRWRELHVNLVRTVYPGLINGKMHCNMRDLPYTEQQGWVSRIYRKMKRLRTCAGWRRAEIRPMKTKAEKHDPLRSSCALPRIGAAKASCIHVYYLFIQSTCSTLSGRGHPHCLPASFFHRFMLLRPWKEIMFCNLYKPIHLLVRLQPALSFFQRVGFFAA